MRRALLLPGVVALGVVATAMPAVADVTVFRLTGEQGNGLLPGNGDSGKGFADKKDSSATGGLIDPKSLYYDANTRRLYFDFAFQDLSSGGLFLPAVHGGIHIHGPTPQGKPGANVGVLYKLNTTDTFQPTLKLSRGPLPEGIRAGRLTGSVQIEAKDLKALLGSQTYINIHSKKYPNGEIRGTLVPQR